MLSTWNSKVNYLKLLWKYKIFVINFFFKFSNNKNKKFYMFVLCCSLDKLRICIQKCEDYSTWKVKGLFPPLNIVLFVDPSRLLVYVGYISSSSRIDCFTQSRIYTFNMYLKTIVVAFTLWLNKKSYKEDIKLFCIISPSSYAETDELDSDLKVKNAFINRFESHAMSDGQLEQK